MNFEDFSSNSYSSDELPNCRRESPGLFLLCSPEFPGILNKIKTFEVNKDFSF
jgi:hypothetical protein